MILFVIAINLIRHTYVCVRIYNIDIIVDILAKKLVADKEILYTPTVHY